MTTTRKSSEATGLTFQGHTVPKVCSVCQGTIASFHSKGLLDDDSVVHYTCADIEQSKRDNQLRPSPKAQEAMDERLRESVRETLVDAGVDPDHWPVADRDDTQISESDMDAFLDSDEEDVVAAYAEEEELADRISRDCEEFNKQALINSCKALDSLAKTASEIRQFDTGATRDTDDGKLDYEAFLSPLVLERYAQHLHKHRVQSDGKMRDGDNWQRGIPKKVYMKSAFRHFIDWWSHHRHPGKDGIEEAICSLIFNAMGYLHELLKERKDDGG